MKQQNNDLFLITKRIKELESQRDKIIDSRNIERIPEVFEIAKTISKLKAWYWNIYGIQYRAKTKRLSKAFLKLSEVSSITVNSFVEFKEAIK